MSTPPRPPRSPLAAAAAVLAAFAAGAGCLRQAYDPARAVEGYPLDRTIEAITDIQVFRERDTLVIVNSTAHSYRDVTVWVNQRYALHVPQIAAGETVHLPLWDFFDERGEVIKAGGFFRTAEPTPVRLVELERNDTDGGGMIGLITIRAEDAE